MSRANEEDMLVIRMGIDALLDCVRQTEAWWRACGHSAALHQTQQLGRTVLATRRKFFPDENASDTQVIQALIIAEGLREAARQCSEGQAALRARLVGAAEAMEGLCRSRE